MTPDDMTQDEAEAHHGLVKAMQLAHKTASDAGWYKNPATGEDIKRNFGEVVALMHSELSEALEADRKGLMDDKLPHRDGREVEFAGRTSCWRHTGTAFESISRPAMPSMCELRSGREIPPPRATWSATRHWRNLPLVLLVGRNTRRGRWTPMTSLEIG